MRKKLQSSFRFREKQKTKQGRKKSEQEGSECDNFHTSFWRMAVRGERKE